MDQEFLYRESHLNKADKREFFRKPDENKINLEESPTVHYSFYQWIVSFLQDIFLPEGYPDSVSPDYVEYQIWDTCQAFCSSVSGTLTMTAVMQGIGVGSDVATPLSAAITWILRDGTGMFGRILFAWWIGTDLDADCKKWRLFADVLNDIAMSIELQVPNYLNYSKHLLCLSTVLKALVGIAGGATRAALTTHQAIKGNTADVSAKDSSQETLVNLLAYVFGVFLLKTCEQTDVAGIVTALTILHLLFNYKAVKCLRLKTFNSTRFLLTLRTYLTSDYLATPEQINRNEPVFLGQSVTSKSLCGFNIKMGASISRFMYSNRLTADDFLFLKKFARHRNYLLMPDMNKKIIYVTFISVEDEEEVILAYFHAVYLGLAISIFTKTKNIPVVERQRTDSPLHHLTTVLNDIANLNMSYDVELPAVAIIAAEEVIPSHFQYFKKRIQANGWNMERHQFIIGPYRGEWIQEKSSLKIESTNETNDSNSETKNSPDILYF